MVADKNEAIRLLKEAGHDVVNDHGAVMFRGCDFKTAHKACKSIGYNGSFGVNNKEESKEL